MKRFAVPLLLLVFVCASCQVGSEPGPTGLSREEIAADVLSAMDLSADPCQDFYRYACGNWLDETERPADQASWTRSFNVVIEKNREIVREMLEEAGADPAGDPDRERVGHYYASCMDEEAVDAGFAMPLLVMRDPMFASLRDDPRFVRLMESMTARLAEMRRRVETLDAWPIED